jgi:hypothetical protein
MIPSAVFRLRPKRISIYRSPLLMKLNQVYMKSAIKANIIQKDTASPDRRDRIKRWITCKAMRLYGLQSPLYMIQLGV